MPVPDAPDRRRCLVGLLGFGAASVAQTGLAQTSDDHLDASGFHALMARVADGWARQDAELALSAFAEDAIYMEPPDLQYYQGHDQLRPYFAAVGRGAYLRFNHLSFDTSAQRGAAEYSYGVEGKDRADHGVAVVELRVGKIAFWREYQRKGPAAFADFIAVDGKDWKWTIRNYP